MSMLENNALARRTLKKKNFALSKGLRLQSLRSVRFKEQALAYGLLAPSLLLFSVFLFYPLLKSVYLSLHLTDPRGRIAAFAGLDNFKELFTSDAFVKSLQVTLSFTLLTVPTCIILALLLASLSHNKLRGIRWFRFIFSLPVAISVGTGSVIWMMLYHPTLGTLNYFLRSLGLGTINWLTDPAWALLSVAVMTVWMNLGFNYIVLLSALQGVPEEIYDSAKIDGSRPLRTFARITLPLISPTLFFVGIVSVIGAFQSFGQIHILTKGGPMNSTDVIVFNIYQDAFVNFRFGIGSAQALVLFAIILILTVVQFRFLERKVHYQ
ncbi:MULTISPECIES: sugar ABC transporter permease [unclassified Paenibacillus]|uniref:carbohydrate ABC transporter permease n=1 Tax=unclassified Paenibacillus TaxID=185978 RepID=UPI001AE24B9E|nr:MULTISPECIES: sugar ABC transporter permease [unclassified Paenibacillus]MBP1157133.1 sn-glycerol 3-phosphate transport system permease protein [Paenibacillus sp. PvP091]MBP1172128.1 sn-glycerol 3-phosphate transport system permease protein [Paenibacillus sp. PvR098]MBP2438509.1 sn-glycerol 3-phosphate transport system permease protein [Paenibacillus sp. PvP052]